MADKWAPLVYARTLEVDYRTIVVPDDFTPALTSEALRYIQATTTYSNNLPNQPRWIIFSLMGAGQSRHTVFGVTCMAIEVTAASDKTRDLHNRPVRTFLGYVSPVSNPRIPSLSAELFGFLKELYSFVEQHWVEKGFQSSQQETTKYDSEIPSYLLQIPSETQPTTEINVNSNEVFVWMTSPMEPVWNVEQDLAVWNTVSQSLGIKSLCLRFASRRHAIENNPFLNCTIIEPPASGQVGAPPERHSRLLQKPEKIVPLTNSQTQRPKSQPKEESRPWGGCLNIFETILGTQKDNDFPHASSARGRDNPVDTMQQSKPKKGQIPSGFKSGPKVVEDNLTEDPSTDVQTNSPSQHSKRGKVPPGFKVSENPPQTPTDNAEKDDT